HGVVIPRENIKHLMLRSDVVDAIEKQQFGVFGVQSIDEAVLVLTGIDAGERDGNGQFPQGTVNRKVEEQLLRYANLRRQFATRKDPENSNEQQ
ncbi:MAG: ATP-dependent protease, partial [Gammaproteobacteria bacterium]|nr:ATP-dependent protease [Gammaproteobacteria bacterium]